MQNQDKNDNTPRFVQVFHDQEQEDNVSEREGQFEIGTLVELLPVGVSTPLYGVIKWIGFLPSPEFDSKMAGIELVNYCLR